jgi:META domain-containing protein
MSRRPIKTTRPISQRNGMLLTRVFLKRAALAMAFAAAGLLANPAGADEGFPFGFEMTLDGPPQPGSKRIPTLEIGDNGEAKLDLWCKSGTGQFSVAGNTVIFVPGQLQDRGCTPPRAQADDDLIAALSEATTWRRRGDQVSFAGTRPLRFRINTN